MILTTLYGRTSVYHLRSLPCYGKNNTPTISKLETEGKCLLPVPATDVSHSLNSQNRNIQ